MSWSRNIKKMPCVSSAAVLPLKSNLCLNNSTSPQVIDAEPLPIIPFDSFIASDGRAAYSQKVIVVNSEHLLLAIANTINSYPSVVHAGVRHGLTRQRLAPDANRGIGVLIPSSMNE